MDLTEVLRLCQNIDESWSHCACSQGTEPEIWDFCSLVLFPRWTDLHIWHTCSYPHTPSSFAHCAAFMLFVRRQWAEVFIRAKPGWHCNLHPAGLTPTPSGGLRTGVDTESDSVSLLIECWCFFANLMQRKEGTTNILAGLKPNQREGSCQNRPLNTF